MIHSTFNEHFPEMCAVSWARGHDIVYAAAAAVAASSAAADAVVSAAIVVAAAAAITAAISLRIGHDNGHCESEGWDRLVRAAGTTLTTA